MRMYFLDSTEKEKLEYHQDGFARFHNQIIGSGVSDVESLEVSAKTNMAVGIGAGWIFSNGFSLELENAETLTHDVADPTNDRIDRVIIRFDTNPEERRFYPAILKGTPSSNPVPPSLTRDSYIQEMSLAQVRIVAGKSFVEQSQIADERANDAVCGYIPLHNIYRALHINEVGMVTMPNQSFIKTRNRDVQFIPRSVASSDPIKVKFGVTEVDKQKEIINDEQFRAKADGVYHFWVELAFKSEDVQAGGRINIYVFVNDEESFPLGTKAFNNSNDRFMMLSGFDELKKGDIVDFRLTTTGFSGDSATEFTRVRVAKSA